VAVDGQDRVSIPGRGNVCVFSTTSYWIWDQAVSYAVGTMASFDGG